MPRLAPFDALRYTSDAGKPSDLLAPPYDVIDAAMAGDLRERSPFNAVHLVLPEGDDEARYAAAAERLARWRDDGALATSGRPAVFVYRQRYEREGRHVERHALFAALELEEPGAGVLPHERTHEGPKADRLALTLATRAQLSPIFLLARDPESALLEALRLVSSAPGDLDATTEDGIRHTLWEVDEEGSAAVLCALAGRLPLLIADGHHRYETALEVSRRLGSDAASRVLACVVSARDPGLVIRPTHRTVASFDDLAGDALIERLARSFEVEPLDADASVDPMKAEAEAARDGAGMILLSRSAARGRSGRARAGGGRSEADGTAAPSAAFRLSPKSGSDRAGGTPGSSAAERIAAVQFDRHVVRGILDTDADAAAGRGLLEYHRDAGEAVRRAGRGGGAFLLPAVALDAVWEATAAGVRLPPKSTYFEPKIPSGLLFRPLSEDETGD